MPSSETPAANGTTTAMMAVAAHSAAITDACASSTGCSEPARRVALERRVAVISRFCQSPLRDRCAGAVTADTRPHV